MVFNHEGGTASIASRSETVSPGQPAGPLGIYKYGASTLTNSDCQCVQTKVGCSDQWRAERNFPHMLGVAEGVRVDDGSASIYLPYLVPMEQVSPP